MPAWQRLEKLNDEQKLTLKELREDLTDVLTSQYDDLCLLRYLIARNFDRKKTEIMIRKSITWRKEMGVDKILTDFKIPKEFTDNIFTQFLGFDKDGRSVRYYFAGRADVKGMIDSIQLVNFLKTGISFYESDRERMWKHNEMTGKRADTLIIIEDIKDISILKLTNKTVINALLELVKSFEANYPETLYRLYFVRAPALISTICNIIMPLLTERTRGKFVFLSGDDWKERLMEDLGSEVEFPQEIEKF